MPMGTFGTMGPRAPLESEIDPLAELWRASWHDAHADLIPAAVVRRRTLEDFTERLRSNLPNVRVAGPPGAPSGLCIVRDDELDQLFVSAAARGSGVAATLLADAEVRIAANGVRTAWLACAIGNERAGRFYRKHGWRRVGTTSKQVPTDDGVVGFELWRYEKDVEGCR